uniref:Uncharacterized protein n=1 Tax=Anopheles melas TaxID=34690 RepID=A0A182U1V1_9DIPT
MMELTRWSPQRCATNRPAIPSMAVGGRWWPVAGTSEASIIVTAMGFPLLQPAILFCSRGQRRMWTMMMMMMMVVVDVSVLVQSYKLPTIVADVACTGRQAVFYVLHESRLSETVQPTVTPDDITVIGRSVVYVVLFPFSSRVELLGRNAVLLTVAPLDSDCSLWFDWVSLWLLSEAIRSRLLSLLSSLCRKLEVSDDGVCFWVLSAQPRAAFRSCSMSLF